MKEVTQLQFAQFVRGAERPPSHDRFIHYYRGDRCVAMKELPRVYSKEPVRYYIHATE